MEVKATLMHYGLFFHLTRCLNYARARCVAARAAAKQLNKVPFQVVKPARLHFARTARAPREAPCPNVQPRAHARLTGLTTFQAPLVLWSE